MSGGRTGGSGARAALLLALAALLAGCGLEAPPERPKPKPGKEVTAPGDTPGEVSIEGDGFISGPITSE